MVSKLFPNIVLKAKQMTDTAGFLWFFLGVETKGRTLEELQEVFDSKWPPRAALQKRKMVKAEDGHLNRVQHENGSA